MARGLSLELYFFALNEFTLNQIRLEGDAVVVVVLLEFGKQVGFVKIDYYVSCTRPTEVCQLEDICW